MNVLKAATATALIVFSAGSLAARPTSIVFDSNAADSEGKAYARYIVKCSNGKKAELTAWDNRKKWCVGDATSEACERKQINAAKDACKNRQPS